MKKRKKEGKNGSKITREGLAERKRSEAECTTAGEMMGQMFLGGLGRKKKE
jgi:hypothetical protein